MFNLNPMIYIRIAIGAVIMGILLYIGYIFNKLDRTEVKLNESISINKKIKQEMDLQSKIIEDMKYDFVYYEKQEDISISKDNNISESLKLDEEYNYKNVFNKIRRFK